MRGSDFAELRAFAAVVERASFARAADHLGFSPSALSQTIRQLETRLGVRLLNRITRSVPPRLPGARLYERIARVIQDLDAAVAEVVEATGRTAGTLRINTLSMAADKLIAPRLGRFHRAYPQVVLDIVIDNGLSGRQPCKLFFCTKPGPDILINHEITGDCHLRCHPSSADPGGYCERPVGGTERTRSPGRGGTGK